MKELLRELCTLDGVAGYEDEVREVIMQKVAPYAAEMTVDPLGNLIVFKKAPMNANVLSCCAPTWTKSVFWSATSHPTA